MTAPNIDSGTRVRIAPSVYARPFGEELVVLDFSRGEYFGLDETGAFVWGLLSEGKSLGETATALTGHFDVDRETAERDVVALVSELSAASLVVLREPEADI